MRTPVRAHTGWDSLCFAMRLQRCTCKSTICTRACVCVRAGVCMRVCARGHIQTDTFDNARRHRQRQNLDRDRDRDEDTIDTDVDTDIATVYYLLCSVSQLLLYLTGTDTAYITCCAVSCSCHSTKTRVLRSSGSAHTNADPHISKLF